MPQNDQATIARVYAQAMLELANSQGLAASLDQEFSELATYLKIDSDLRYFFESPIVDVEVRRQTLDKIFQSHASDLLLNTLQVLNRKNRMVLIGDVQQQYHQLYMEQEGVVEACVISAEPLSDTMRQRVRQVMASRTGKRVQLIESLDPQILGGLVVRVGDEKIDLSVSRQLSRIYETIQEHASRHIHAGSNLFEEATVY